MTESTSRDQPLESTGNDKNVDLPVDSSDVKEEESASVKRENPDDGIFLRCR